MKNKPNLDDIYTVFTRNPVLLPLIPGTKIISVKGWPDTTWEDTQNEAYQARLRATPNVGILLGKNSNDLVSFDFDTPPSLKWFLENNPEFKNSFVVTGRGSGGQVFGYARSGYPANAELFVPEGSELAQGARKPPANGKVQIGEFRATRLQSVLCGIHPDTKRPYSWPGDNPPIEFAFGNVKWHPDIILPWLEKTEFHGNGNEEDGPLKEATRVVTIDALWKYFEFPKRAGNPGSSPFRDDNNIDHPSFSIWFDEKTGKQVFKDFNAAYAHHKGDSYNFYQLAAKLDSHEAFIPFMQLCESLKNGETPAPQTEEATIDIAYYKPPPAIKPPVIGEAAYRGFAGRWIAATEPQAECNRDNLLLQLLTCLGVLFGRYWYNYLGAKLFTNLFTVILGPTGARKGTALEAVKEFVAQTVPEWHGVDGDWKSGEALVYFTRDQVKGVNRTGGEVVKDPGVDDKRILVEETELINLFKVGERSGNTLLATLCKAWESPDRMASKSKNMPATSTGPHIGTLGHMTGEGLLQIDPENLTSGLINRALWGNAFQARIIDDPQEPRWPSSLLEEFLDIYAYAHGPVQVAACDLDRPTVKPLLLDANARLLWSKIRREADGETGTLALVLKRFLSQVRKVALIYALLDKSDVIAYPHLESGLAVAEHSRACARIFFAGFGPNKLANKILAALRRNPKGLSKTDIHKHVTNYKASGDEIHEALIILLDNGLIRANGRVWFAS